MAVFWPQHRGQFRGRGVSQAIAVFRCVSSVDVGWLSAVAEMGCLFGVFFLEKHVRRCNFAMFSWLTGDSSEREGLIRKATWGSHVPEMICSPEVCNVTFRLQAEQHLQVTLLSLVCLTVRGWESECFFPIARVGPRFRCPEVLDR